MPDFTANLDFNLPLVNDPVDEDLWGGYLNDNFDELDVILPNTTRSVSSNFSVTTADFNKLIKVNTSGGTVTATIGTASTFYDGFNTNFVITTGTFPLVLSSVNTINGTVTQTVVGQYSTYKLNTDGSVWYQGVNLPIADGSITLAKMASGTTGNLITYGTTGVPTVVSTGTATHVLTSNGSGAVPTFQLSTFVQHTVGSTSALATITSTTIGFDDSIPQITEGTQVISVDIAPKSASSKLLIRANIFGSSTSSSTAPIAALFNGATDALTAGSATSGGGTFNLPTNIPLNYEMVSGTVGTITFSVRCGVTQNSFLVNGTDNGDARLFGTIPKTYLEVIEVTA